MKIIVTFKGSGVFRNDIEPRLNNKNQIEWHIDSDKIKEVQVCP